MTTIEIKMQTTLEWTASQSASCNRWIAECEALGIAMEGDSLDEVYSLIGETCFALFRDLVADGELDQFLRARGWSAANLPTGPVDDDVEFSIPWSLVTQGNADGAERRAH